MNLHVPKPMTVDEYLTWALDNPGRFELIDGVVRQMSPETAGHADVKAQVYIALRAAIKIAGLPYVAMPDGMTVRVTKDTAFEPDALVYPLPRVQSTEMEIPNPVIIVEVGSTSTRKYDAGFKLQGYMGLASVEHVLLVNVAKQTIIHHRRVSQTHFDTTTVTDGTLRLDPPGLDIAVADFFKQD